MTGVLLLENSDVVRIAEKICVSIDDSGFLPDLVVGVGKGGAVPGVMISNYFDVPYINVSWSRKNSDSNESNCWLPEDAYNGKQILVVDDICRTGSTLEEICEDWDSSIRGLPDFEKWYDNVRFATLHAAENVEFTVDYVGEYVTDYEDIEYPWECWWA